VAANSCAGVMESALSTLVVSCSCDVEHAAPADAIATIQATTNTFRPVNMTQTNTTGVNQGERHSREISVGEVAGAGQITA